MATTINKGTSHPACMTLEALAQKPYSPCFDADDESVVPVAGLRKAGLRVFLCDLFDRSRVIITRSRINHTIDKAGTAAACEGPGLVAKYYRLSERQRRLQNNMRARHRKLAR